MAAKRKQWIGLLTGGVLLLASAVVIGVIWVGPRGMLSSQPAPAGESTREIVAFMATEDFAKLPEERRQEYFDRLADGGNPHEAFRLARELPEEQRRQLRKNVGGMMHRRMEQRMEEYFQLPPEQRQQHLDETIDRMLAHRREIQAQRSHRLEQVRENQAESAEGNSGPDHPRRERHRGPTPERLKRRIEHSNPETRAKFMQYMKDMRQRMKERSIDPPRHGPGRR